MIRKIIITVFVAICLSTICLLGCKHEEITAEPVDLYYVITYFDGSYTREQQVKYGESFKIKYIPSKEGSSFLGLYDNADGGIKWVDNNGNSTMPYGRKSNVTLYPMYERRKFTFKFDYGESGDFEVTQQVEYNDTLPTPPTPTPVYARRFTGWYIDKECKTKADITASVTYKAWSQLKTESSITLYAGYEDIYYDVVLNVDGKVIYSKSLKCGTPLTEFLITKLEDGREIAAWSEQENGSPCYYVELEKPLTLYAVKIGYKITFNTDGGEEIDGVVGYSGYETLLPTPQKQFYDFQGWLLDSKNVGTLFTMPKKNITLVASWKRAYFTVMYDTDGAETIESIMVRAGNSVTLPQPEKLYYAFEGWTYNNKVIGENFKMPESNITLIAKWKRSYYEVEYNADGGEKVNSVMTKVGSAVQLPSYVERQYYSFLGWLYNGKIVEGELIMPESNIKLMASWKQTHYLVEYNTDGGEKINSAMTKVGNIVQLPYPEKQYYSFVSWLYNGNVVEGELIMPESNIKLMATWKKTHYLVEYNTDGGEKINSVMTRVGDSVPLPSAEKQYYSFVNWLYNGNIVEGEVIMPANNIKLTATWVRTHYAISIMSSIDGRIIDKIWVKNGEPYVFVPPVIAGYQCVGLFDTQDSPQEDNKVFDADMTFTAKFTPRQYEVSYNFDGGTAKTNATKASVTYNAAYNLVVPEKAGYVFNGWYLSDNTKLTDHTGVSIKSWDIIGNETVRAKWLPLTVRFVESTKQLITHDGYEYNYYDTLNLKEIFGLSISEFIKRGYKSIEFKVSVSISEKDDGYQYFCVNNRPATKVGCMFEQQMNHSAWNRDTSIWTHGEYTFTVSLNSLNDIIYISYDASGQDRDDWYRHSVTVNMRIFK